MFSPRRGDAGVSRLAARGAGVAVPGGVFGLDLVLLLVVEEVAARPVGAVARDPVLLTPLGLVLTVLANVSHLLEISRRVTRIFTSQSSLLTSFP